MTTTARRWPQLEMLAWSILLGLSVMWLLFLFFQRGQIFDESEHAHVAWLISQGKRPINDFFQHHMPLLWSLLALYFRAGFTGAAVLIWGRILVLASGAISLAALWMLGRPAEDSRRLISYLGPAAFIALTAFLPELFVIRPETIATVAFLLALVLWNAPGGSAQVVLAGALAGAAMYATPRFALLGGLFFLIGISTVRRWLSLAAGALCFVGVYTWLSGFEFEKVLFSLRFSSYLQFIGGQAVGRRETTWFGLMLITCLPLFALLFAVPKAARYRSAAVMVYAVFVFLACNHTAGLFRYAQAYAPFIVAVSIAAAYVAARLELPGEPATALALVFPAILLLPSLTFFRPSRPHFDFLASVRARNRLAAMVPAGGTVLLFTRDNPITVPDASYYGIPLNDGKDRLCRAVRGFHSRFKLPPCDLLKTLQDAKPYLTDSSISAATSNEPKAQQVIEENYSPVNLGPSFPSFIQTDTERRDN